MQSIRRVIAAMTGALALTTTGVLAVVPAASAKDGPLSVQSVWVGDIHQNHRTVLNSGDTATYHMDVDNTTGKTMKVEIEFEVFDIEGPSSYSYYYTAHQISMPPGLTRFYSPSTIPLNATTDNYMARISIWPTNSANPSNDGDWAEADFHIFSLTVSPVNAAIQDLQNAALCVAGIVSFGSDDILLESVQHYGTDEIGFFKDIQTGNVYWAYVNLTPIGTLHNCIAALTGAGAVFHVYQMATM
jgi:hypothetical protein